MCATGSYELDRGSIRPAKKELRALPQSIRRRIDIRLGQLEHDPFARGTKKLAVGKGFRIAVGSYRIIYMTKERARLVTVTAILHRREAYR